MGKVIEGSKKWGKVVPDEYAIKCTHEQTEGDYRILEFSYVKSVRNELGAGFVEKIAIAIIPAETEGILIARTDYFPVPDIYLINKGQTKYNGILNESTLCFLKRKIPNFNKVFHYSARAIEKQKSDENAPDWLKLFARQHSANVAYFEF